MKVQENKTRKKNWFFILKFSKLYKKYQMIIVNSKTN